MKKVIKAAMVVAIALTLNSCEKDEVKISNKSVIENYATIVHQNYKDSHDEAVTMQNKINTFLNNPTQETLTAAKNAWLTARDVYGLSEVYRGSGGPIDNETSNAAWAINNEGQINAWPLNEAYIDYVAEKNSYTGTYDQSIVGGTEAITKEMLASKNEAVGANDDEKRKAVSTGWHAIEFLLWGQDNTIPADKKAGQRPVEDYTTNANAARRKTYLRVVTELLVEDLKKLSDTWAKGGQYYTYFMALPEKTAIDNIIKGPNFLASFELSNERLLGPAVSTDGIDGSGQEDEHSCFSDNTHRDVYTNAKGIANVLLGEYDTIKGASVIDLISQEDKALGNKLRNEVAKMMATIKKIDDKAKAGTPFDLMLVQENVGNEGEIMNSDAALKNLAKVIQEGAAKLKITINDITE